MKCDYCESGTILNPAHATCISCSEPAMIYAPRAECHKCPNRFYEANYQSCYSCDTTTGKHATADGTQCITE